MQSAAGRYGFLDGLRGWGAVFVLLYHVFCDVLPPHAPIARTMSLLIPFNGVFAVYVFFIVSGFSLTIDYLVRGDLSALTRIAAGRYLRLAIPVFLACLVVHLALLWGLIGPPSERLPVFQQAIHFEPTTSHLFRFAFFDVFFNYQNSDTYIRPLWTMSYELIGSFIVLAAALVLRPLKARLLILLILLGVLLNIPALALFALFPIGFLLADALNRGWLDDRPFLGSILLAAGASIPLLLPHSPRLWELAAVAVVCGSISIPRVRRFLENPTSLHLGKICFPLYLMHGPVMWIVGDPLTRNFGHTIGLRLSVDLLVVAISFAASYAFLPANNLGIWLARRAGAMAAAGIALARLARASPTR